MVVMMVLFNRGGDELQPTTVQAEESPVDRGPAVSQTNWDSPLVTLAREMHQDVLGGYSHKLFVRLDFPKAYLWRAGLLPGAEWTGPSASGMESETETDIETDTESEFPTEALPWASLSGAQQTDFKNDLVDNFMEGDDQRLVADWKPFDGSVILEEDELAVVRLKVQHRDASAGLADRWIEWRYVRRKDKWLTWYWARWTSPQEVKTERIQRAKSTVRKTLSDGSQVIEAEVRTDIAYHEETTQELRDEIEALIDTILDPEPESRKVITVARMRIEEIGKHAVPGLLSRMGAIPLDSEENAIQLQQLHMELSFITDYQTTFDVHASLGGTQERQFSGLRQWYGWYERMWPKFWKTADEFVAEDPFWDDPDFRPRNEQERQEFEKLRREHEAQRDDGL